MAFLMPSSIHALLQVRIPQELLGFLNVAKIAWQFLAPGGAIKSKALNNLSIIR
jgi:hypothetical protein